MVKKDASLPASGPAPAGEPSRAGPHPPRAWRKKADKAKGPAGGENPAVSSQEGPTKRSPDTDDIADGKTAGPDGDAVPEDNEPADEDPPAQPLTKKAFFHQNRPNVFVSMRLPEQFARILEYTQEYIVRRERGAAGQGRKKGEGKRGKKARVTVAKEEDSVVVAGVKATVAKEEDSVVKETEHAGVNATVAKEEDSVVKETEHADVHATVAKEEDSVVKETEQLGKPTTGSPEKQNHDDAAGAAEHSDVDPATTAKQHSPATRRDAAPGPMFTVVRREKMHATLAVFFVKDPESDFLKARFASAVAAAVQAARAAGTGAPSSPGAEDVTEAAAGNLSGVEQTGVQSRSPPVVPIRLRMDGLGAFPGPIIFARIVEDGGGLPTGRPPPEKRRGRNQTKDPSPIGAFVRALREKFEADDSPSDDSPSLLGPPILVKDDKNSADCALHLTLTKPRRRLRRNQVLKRVEVSKDSSRGIKEADGDELETSEVGGPRGGDQKSEDRVVCPGLVPSAALAGLLRRGRAAETTSNHAKTDLPPTSTHLPPVAVPYIDLCEMKDSRAPVKGRVGGVGGQKGAGRKGRVGEEKEDSGAGAERRLDSAAAGKGQKRRKRKKGERSTEAAAEADAKHVPDVAVSQDADAPNVITVKEESPGDRDDAPGGGVAPEGGVARPEQEDPDEARLDEDADEDDQPGYYRILARVAIPDLIQIAGADGRNLLEFIQAAYEGFVQEQALSAAATSAAAEVVSGTTSAAAEVAAAADKACGATAASEGTTSAAAEPIVQSRGAALKDLHLRKPVFDIDERTGVWSDRRLAAAEPLPSDSANANDESSVADVDGVSNSISKRNGGAGRRASPKKKTNRSAKDEVIDAGTVRGGKEVGPVLSAIEEGRISSEKRTKTRQRDGKKTKIIWRAKGSGGRDSAEPVSVKS